MADTTLRGTHRGSLPSFEAQLSKLVERFGNAKIPSFEAGALRAINKCHATFRSPEVEEVIMVCHFFAPEGRAEISQGCERSESPLVNVIARIPARLCRAGMSRPKMNQGLRASRLTPG